MSNAGAQAHEQYTIRQKVFKIFGDSFHIYDPQGHVVGYCKQKFMRFREDIRFYTDESQSTELFAMKARSILDFSTTYDVLLPEGGNIGSLRRKGFKSMLRDEWLVFNADGSEIGRIREDSMGLALVRRVIPVLSFIFPQRFELHRTAPGEKIPDGSTPVAVFRTHFSLFVYKLGIAITNTDDQVQDEFDDLLILASGCLLAAIEGRQGSEGSGSGLFSGD